MKVFDTNQYFKFVGLFYGDYDGDKIVLKKPQSTFYVYYSKFWSFIAFAYVVRYSILTFSPRKTVLEFYFCDYAQQMPDKSYRWMMLAGPLFNSWLLLVIRLFNSANHQKKYGYFLKFLQIPKTRHSTDLQIDGFTDKQIKKFWRFSNFLQHYFLKTLVISGLITMTFACLNYVYASRTNSYYYNLHSLIVFWIIALVNYCTLLSLGPFGFSCCFGMILYLFLICKFLKDRFDCMQTKFKRIAYFNYNNNKELDLNKLDQMINQMIHQFNLIIDDLQRCNFVFSKFNFLNYYYGIFICSELLMVSLNSDDYAIMSFAGLLFIFVYIPVLTLSFASCGALHNSVLANHRPLMKLLERKGIKSITAIRIQRILEWISSDYATFRCLNLFPMKQILIVEVFFSIIAQSILIYDITFNLL